jgi:hypothetical protein
VFVCDAGVGQSEVVIVVEEVLKCPSIAAHQGHWDPQDPYDPPKSPYNNTVNLYGRCILAISSKLGVSQCHCKAYLKYDKVESGLISLLQ